MLDGVFVTSNISMAFANDPRGVPLQNLETTFEGLEQKLLDDFAASLTNIGNLFDLIQSDWGRLQALGKPLVELKIVWDDTIDGAALNSMDRGLRRQYFPKLMAGAEYEMGQWANVANGTPPTLQALYPFTSYQERETRTDTCICKFDTPHSDAENWLTLPSGPTRDFNPQPGHDGQYYDVFMFGTNSICSSNNNGGPLCPMFSRLDLNDPTKLGIYKPYFFLYSPFNRLYNAKCNKGDNGICEN